MNASSLVRYALSFCAGAVLLAACGPSPFGSAANATTALRAASAELTRSSGSYKVLYSFAGGSDGSYPEAGLLDVKGTLYGTTSNGGGRCKRHRKQIECGTVFAISTTGKHRVLYGFHPNTGAPLTNLIDLKGTLYSTTFDNDGTIFAITASGKETLLYRFRPNSGDGGNPWAGLVNVDGTLYGTTYLGGIGAYKGTVFAITTLGKESVLHKFAGGSGDGERPEASLVNVDGTLYGTTSAGGTYGYSSISGGTVFAITTSGAETVIHSFGGSGDGALPFAGLLNVDGTLYGTTWEGGAYDRGTVFAITTSGTETVLHSFGASGDGKLPDAGLVDINGALYGTTQQGGANNTGTVFAIKGSGAESVIHSFGSLNSGDGWDPQAGLIDVNRVLYGTTIYGGMHGAGTVFAFSL
jgi:uncharacterized repeat protein (TIGR03803 family)